MRRGAQLPANRPEFTKQAIGDRLYVIRRVFKLPQSIIANECGLEVYTWNAVERGHSNISWQYATMICEKTGVTLDYIYRDVIFEGSSDKRLWKAILDETKRQARLKKKNGAKRGRWAKREDDVRDEAQLELLRKRREIMKKKEKQWRADLPRVEFKLK